MIEQSIAPLLLALAKQPEAVEPLQQLVANYLALKQSDKAIIKLRELTDKQPKHFYAYFLLGEVYARTKQFNEAIATYQKASHLKGEWPLPYHGLAVAYLALKRDQAAIDSLREGLVNTHQSLDLVADLAALYRQLGQTENAIKLYDELHNKNPQSTIVLQRYVQLLNETAKSDADLAKAAQLAEPLAQSNDTLALDTAAWVAYHQTAYQKAQDLLKKFLNLNPAFVLANYHLGMVYFKKGDAVHAREFLNKAVDAHQDFAGLNEAKATLQELAKSK